VKKRGEKVEVEEEASGKHSMGRNSE